MRERHREGVQLAPDAADLAERLAEVHLGVPGRMRQGDEHLLGPALLLPDIVGDDGDAAGEAVLVAQPLEDPLCRMPLLLGQRPVRLEDLVDDRNERVELRARRRLRSPVARRHRVLEDLRHRLAVDPEQPGRRSLAQPIDMARSPHTRIELHRIHLPAFSSFASGAKWRSFTPRQSEHPTASVAHFVSGIHRLFWMASNTQSDRVISTSSMRPSRVSRTISADSIRPKTL
jgi:hypothetical protein